MVPDQVNASEHEQVDTNGDGQINMDDDTVVRLNAKLTATSISVANLGRDR